VVLEHRPGRTADLRPRQARARRLPVSANDATRSRNPRLAPGFIDYVFLAFTNATAFSPTDTLPLSQRAKLLMMAEAMISLLTIALVAARAVNILA
jgi:hypothetical protein